MTLVNLSRRAPAQLPDGTYDVRGWEVRTALDSKSVGKVDDMLLDEQGNPRYVEVKLGVFRRHVLVPLREAHADPGEQVVWIDDLDEERLSRVPAYDRDTERLSPEYERRLTDEYRSLAMERPDDEPVEERGRGGLSRLSDMGDFRVAKGVTDPTGWKVVGGDGSTVGEVSELIVDQDSLSTRYLDVAVDEKPLDLEPLDRHVLVPVEHVRLDRKAKHVVVDGIFARDLRDYPLYQGLPLDEETERSIADLYERRGDGQRSDPETRRFFGTRTRPGDAAPGARPRRVRTREEELEGEAVSGGGSERTVEAREGEEVRIRLSGDDIVIERKPRGRRRDG